MAVKTAFLIPILPPEEVVYIRPFKGLAGLCESTNIPLDVHLRCLKAIYGLRQTSAAWSDELTTFLISLGMIQSKEDPCIWIHSQGAMQLFVVYVVDDLLIGGDQQRVEAFEATISKRFPMKHLKDPKNWCGIELRRTKRGINIGQQRFVDRALERFGLENGNATTIPASAAMLVKKGIPVQPNCPYREAVGTLLR